MTAAKASSAGEMLSMRFTGTCTEVTYIASEVPATRTTGSGVALESHYELPVTMYSKTARTMSDLLNIEMIYN
jgi:hypothetical protein